MISVSFWGSDSVSLVSTVDGWLAFLRRASSDFTRRDVCAAVNQALEVAGAVGIVSITFTPEDARRIVG